MKTSNILKVGAVLTASAFLLSSSALNFKGVLPDNKKSVNIPPVVTVLKNTTSSDLETANVELLSNAVEENNYEDMVEICDVLLESIEASKKEIEQTSQAVAEWNNSEISARFEKYQNEINVKSAETINALNEVKQGINVEENLTGIMADIRELTAEISEYEKEIYNLHLQISDLKEKISESNIPFLIDISEFNSIPDAFKNEIEKNYVVIYPVDEV